MEEKIEQAQPDMVSSAQAAADKLRAENERMETNIKKLEQLQAFNILGGKSDGRPQETKPVELSPKEYAALVLAGKIGK